LKGDRIALVAFAGRSFVQCPLTDDYGAAKLFLSLLDSETVPSYGTNLGGAINNALSLFKEGDKHKIIIIVSDGEDLEDQGIKEAEKAADIGARIYTLGIGSPEGSTIPVEESPGNIVYAKDDKGDIILTKLDVTTLNKIANSANGKFFPVTPHQSEIYEILQNINSLEKKKFESREYIKYKEQYRYFLLISLILLIIEILIQYKKKVLLRRVL
jgi:Ca-activated chloride channel family protein